MRPLTRMCQRMAHSTRRKTRVWLRPLGGWAFAGLIAGCASTPTPQTYPLGNDGKPLTHPGSVCVQIGLLNAAREDQGQCYQLVPPGPEHVEPLPLDEFGYLYPPLKPQPAPVIVSRPAPVIVTAPRAAIVAPPTSSKAAPEMALTTKVVEFDTPVPFALNSAHLTPANRVAISTFVNSLERYRGVVDIQVIGHTDSSGSRHFNRWLSGMRAQSVKLHLLALGMDPRHIHVEGVGSSEPLPGSHSAADNRYVEIQVKVRIPEP